MVYPIWVLTTVCSHTQYMALDYQFALLIQSLLVWWWGIHVQHCWWECSLASDPDGRCFHCEYVLKPAWFVGYGKEWLVWQSIVLKCQNLQESSYLIVLQWYTYMSSMLDIFIQVATVNVLHYQVKLIRRSNKALVKLDNIRMSSQQAKCFVFS